MSRERRWKALKVDQREAFRYVQYCHAHFKALRFVPMLPADVELSHCYIDNSDATIVFVLYSEHWPVLENGMVMEYLFVNEARE